MDIRSIKTFMKVAEMESITKASSELGYVQSTVSMQIQLLEKELGYKLFERIGKKIYLTELGTKFRNYAEEMLCISDQMYSLSSSPENMRGTLRIGTIESLLHYTLIYVVPKFKELYPNIDVQIRMGQKTDLLIWLKQNMLDMIYISNDIIVPVDLKCCYRRLERIVFVSDTSHELVGKKISLQDFFNYPVISIEQSGYCYKRIQELAEKSGINIRSSVVIDNTKAIIDMLYMGKGLSFLPSYAVMREINAGKISEIDVDIPPETFYSQILIHKNKYVLPYMNRFIEMIREYKSE